MAPIPGETKVWQYVTLMKRIYLIDCPGIVPQNHHDAPTELLLRGVVRVEKVEHPEQYIPAVLKRVKKHHMAKTYDLSDWNDDHILFLELLARKGGRLLKGGEPDVDGVAKMVLNDFSKWSGKFNGQEIRLLTLTSARTDTMVCAPTSRRRRQRGYHCRR